MYSLCCLNQIFWHNHRQKFVPSVDVNRYFRTTGLHVDSGFCCILPPFNSTTTELDAINATNITLSSTQDLKNKDFDTNPKSITQLELLDTLLSEAVRHSDRAPNCATDLCLLDIINNEPSCRTTAHARPCCISRCYSSSI